MCRPPLNRGIKILFFRLRSLSLDVLFWFALFLAFLGNRVTNLFRRTLGNHLRDGQIWPKFKKSSFADMTL